MARVAVASEGRGTIRPALVFLSALSGFGTLALQVLFTRMFSLVFHNSTYTFGIVVAVFLATLALGAAIASWLQRRVAARRMVGVVTGLGAVATAASVIVFVRLTGLQYFIYGDSFTQYMSGAVVLVTVVIAPGVICLGMLLPLVWGMASSTGGVGRMVGMLTCANTVAAAGGALAANFCLLPWLGLWESIVLVSILFFIAASVLLWRENQKKTAYVLGLVLVVVSAIVLNSPIESESNRIKYGERLVQRWNSAYGWIDVVQNDKSGAFKIRQNLHYRFGATGSNAREFRQAHIPLLLHENPEEVLFLGLGTGLTAGGAIPHSEVKSIVAVELIPEVIEAARGLGTHNYNVVDDPKVEMFVDDARHYMLAHGRRYDVIVSDLFVPWESETGYLYTVEHYRVAAQRLKPGGMFCQWLPLYQVGEREFKSIANSFASVFPHTTIWWGQLDSRFPMIAFIGTDAAVEIDPARLEARLKKLVQNVGTVDPSISSVERFWEQYVGDWVLERSADLNTDEYPRVEFLTPISNRNKRMLRRRVFERFYDEVFATLPVGSATLVGEELDSESHRRDRDRWILFGRD